MPDIGQRGFLFQRSLPVPPPNFDTLEALNHIQQVDYNHDS